jgi:hypothetical protein
MEIPQGQRYLVLVKLSFLKMLPWKIWAEAQLADMGFATFFYVGIVVL